MIKGGELDQNVRGNVALPQFVIAVYLLRAIELGGNVLLRQIVVFSQISDSFEHIFPLFFYHYSNRKLQYNGGGFAQSDSERGVIFPLRVRGGEVINLKRW